MTTSFAGTRTSARIASLIIGIVPVFVVLLALGGCSDSSRPNPASLRSPSLLSITQDRSIDPNGTTALFLMDEPPSDDSIAVLTNYVANDGQKALSAIVLLDVVIRVTFDAPIIPGETTFDVAGIRNLFDGLMIPVFDFPVGSNSGRQGPEITSAVATAVANAHNDTLGIVFDDLLVKRDAVDLDNYSLLLPDRSPPLNVDLSGATISYMGRPSMVTITLIDSRNPVNLQHNERFQVTVRDVRDLGGASIGTAVTPPTLRVVGDGDAPADLPTVVAATQRASVDPLGRTVDVAFSEMIQAPEAPANFVDAFVAQGIGSGTASKSIAAVNVTILNPGDMARVTFEDVVRPGDTIDITKVRDLAGNVMNDVSGQPVLGDDTTRPDVIDVVAETFSGQFNDEIRVPYTEQVLPVGATDPSNFRFESPLGNVISLTAQDLFYDQVTRSTIITLDSQTTPINLVTGTRFRITVTNVRDVAGNVIDAVGATLPLSENGIWPKTPDIATVTGDGTGPTVTASTATAVRGLGNDIITVTLSEDVVQSQVEDLANYALASNDAFGNPVQLTTPLGGSATVTFNPVTHVATIVLPDGSNLDAASPAGYSIALSNIFDHAGNAIGAPNSGSGNVVGDMTAPAFSVARQSTHEGLGRHVNVAFQEVVSSLSSVSAAAAGTGTPNRVPNFVSATRILGGDIVRLSFDDAFIPGEHTLSVSGVRDLAGNFMAPLSNQAVQPVDTTNPTATSVVVTAVEGHLNDTIVVSFDEDMAHAGVEDIANYTLRVGPISPPATVVNISDARVFYDAYNRVVTLTLDSQSVVEQNLQFGDFFQLEIANVMDTSGNALSNATPASPLAGNVGGDMEFPNPAVALGTQKTSVDPLGKTVWITFNEPVTASTALDVTRYAGNNGQACTSATLVTNLAGVSGSTTATPGPVSVLQVVQLTFNLAMTPGTDQVVIAAGITDLAGNAMAGENVIIAAEDTTQPNITSVTVDALEGPFNDVISIVFDEPVLGAADFGTSAMPRFALTVGGAGIDLTATGHTITYDQATNTTTIVLTSQSSPENLDFGAAFTLSVNSPPGIIDVAGNQLATSTDSGTVGTDNVNPTLDTVSAIARQGANDVITAVFSEALRSSGGISPTGALDLENFGLLSDPVSAGAPTTPVPLTVAQGGTADSTIAYDPLTSTVTIVLPDDVFLRRDNEQYNVRLNVTGVEDLAGNDIAAGAFGTTAVEGDSVSPTVLGVVHRLTADPSGRTVDIMFSEGMDDSVLGPFPPPGSNPFYEYFENNASKANPVLNVTRLAFGDGARVVFRDPVQSDGNDTIAARRMFDAAGNALIQARVQIMPESGIAAPNITAFAPLTNEGPYNDVLTVTFDGPVVGANVLSNFRLDDTSVTIDITGSTISYDASSFTTTINLSSQGLGGNPVPVNLQDGESYQVTGQAGITGIDGQPLVVSNLTVASTANDTLGATVSAATQRTTIDPEGRTVFVALSEALDRASAEDVTKYTIAGNTTIAANLLLPTNPATALSASLVQVVFQDRVDPTADTITVDATVLDLAGNQLNGGNAALAVAAEDPTDPTVLDVSATTLPGVQNDILTLTFSEPVLAAEAMDISNYGLESPIGTPLNIDVPADPTPNTISYDASTNTATIVLTSASNPVNLQTSDTFGLVVSNVHDIAGRQIATNATSPLPNPTVGGDMTAPTLVGGAASTLSGGFNDILLFQFSEELNQADVLLSNFELRIGAGPNLLTGRNEIRYTAQALSGLSFVSIVLTQPNPPINLTNGTVATLRVVGLVRDVAGNAIAVNAERTPMVTGDPNGPSMLSASLVATAPATRVIDITFNEALDSNSPALLAATGHNEWTLSAGAVEPGSIVLSSDGTVVRLTATVNQTAGADTIQVDAVTDILDLAGNPLTSNPARTIN